MADPVWPSGVAGVAGVAGNGGRMASVGASVQRLAVLSLHTSPLVQPGSGDSGGMNVYVRELAASLAQSGVGGLPL